MITTIAKDALQAWFAAVTGLTTIWADQGAPRPAYPYATLNDTADRKVADELQWDAEVIAAAWQAAHAYTVGQYCANDTGKRYICIDAGTSAGAGGPTGTDDGIIDGGCIWDYDGTNAVAGTDYVPTISEHSIVTISCQVFAAYRQSLPHNATAKYYLDLARMSLAHPKHLATLGAANLGFVRAEGVQDISTAMDGQHISRANMDIFFNTVASMTDLTAGDSYIEHVLVSSDIEGTDHQLDDEHIGV